MGIQAERNYGHLRLISGSKWWFFSFFGCILAWIWPKNDIFHLKVVTNLLWKALYICSQCCYWMGTQAERNYGHPSLIRGSKCRFWPFLLYFGLKMAKKCHFLLKNGYKSIMKGFIYMLIVLWLDGDTSGEKLWSPEVDWCLKVQILAIFEPQNGQK